MKTNLQENKNAHTKRISPQCTEVRLASLLSGGFTTVAVINPPEKKLANRISVQCGGTNTFYNGSCPNCL